MRSLKILSVLFFLVFFSSCYKNHLYVQIENISDDYLASTQVDTPDYRQKDPPYGQRIIVSWDFPKYLYNEELYILVTARFWNNIQEEKKYKLHRNWGTKTFYFPNKSREKQHKILTYKIDIYNKYGEKIETWKHQFWTKIIDVDTKSYE